MKKLLVLFFIVLIIVLTLFNCTMNGEDGNNGKKGKIGGQGESGKNGENGIVYMNPYVLLFEGITIEGIQAIDLSSVFIGQAIYGVKVTNNETNICKVVVFDTQSGTEIIGAGKSIIVHLDTSDNTFIYSATKGKNIRIELMYYGQ